MCTKEDTINTGISIDTVKESKVKPHHKFSDSESTHLNNFALTITLFIATSKKANRAMIVVNNMHVHVIR
jgi:hypothetical protein